MDLNNRKITNYPPPRDSDTRQGLAQGLKFRLFIYKADLFFKLFERRSKIVQIIGY